MDEAGEPMPGVRVRAFRRTTVDGVKRWKGTGVGITDDRGRYRMVGLRPGEYLIGVLTLQNTLPASKLAGRERPASTSASASLGGAPFTGIAASAREIAGIRIDGFLLATENSGSISPDAASFQSMPPQESGGEPFVYPPTFYPSAITPDEATLVSIAGGEDRRDVDIRIAPTKSTTVHGVLTGAPSMLTDGTGVQLLPVWATQFAGTERVAVAMTEADASGKFTLLGVPPARYLTNVLVAPRAGTVPGRQAPPAPTLLSPDGVILSGATPITRPQAAPAVGDTWWASVPIEVGQEAATGALDVELRKGFRVSGRIRIEPSTDNPQVPAVALSLRPLDQSSGSGMISGVRSDGNGRFASLGYPPGEYFVQATVVPPSNYLVKRILLAGKDVEGGPVDLQSDLSEMEILVTDRAASISGTVHGADLRVPGDTEVVVFPADRPALSSHGALLTDRRVTSARMLANGRYTVTGLPAGQYFIVALLAGDMGDYQDPKFLERLIPGSTRIVLSDGDSRIQDLRPVRLGVVR